MPRQRLSGVDAAEEVLRVLGCCAVRGVVVEQELLGAMQQVQETAAAAASARML